MTKKGHLKFWWMKRLFLKSHEKVPLAKLFLTV